jgi:hypothetical protein
MGILLCLIYRWAIERIWIFNVLRDFKKVVGGRLHPVIKVLIEQVMTEDLFFETPMRVQYDGWK